MNLLSLVSLWLDNNYQIKTYKKRTKQERKKSDLGQAMQPTNTSTVPKFILEGPLTKELGLCLTTTAVALWWDAGSRPS